MLQNQTRCLTVEGDVTATSTPDLDLQGFIHNVPTQASGSNEITKPLFTHALVIDLGELECSFSKKLNQCKSHFKNTGS